jgi:hypothetical protein
MAIQYSERMRPEEAFKRGFYYGLGFWISGIFINVCAALLIFAVLLAVGVVGSAMPGRAGTPQVRQRVQPTLPTTTPSQRKYDDN